MSAPSEDEGKRREKRHKVTGGRWVVHRLWQRGKYWRGRVRDLHTRKVYSVPTREIQYAKAERAVFAWIKAREEAERQVVAPLTERFDRRFEEWLALKDVRPSTLRDYRAMYDGRDPAMTERKRLDMPEGTGVLKPAFRDRFLDEITPKDMEYFLKGLAQRSSRTRRKYLTVLRSFFRWCVRHRHCASDPTDGIKVGKGAKRKGIALTVEEARRLVTACTSGPPYLRLAVLIALYTGLRKRNVLKLSRGQVDLQQGKITVPAEEMKAKADHAVPLHPKLEAVIKGVKPGGVYLLGKNFETIRKSFKSALKRAGLPGNIRWHDLRHSFATWLGGSQPWAVVQALLAHTPQNVTWDYQHPSFDRLREAIATLPDLTAEG